MGIGGRPNGEGGDGDRAGVVALRSEAGRGRGAGLRECLAGGSASLRGGCARVWFEFQTVAAPENGGWMRGDVHPNSVVSSVFGNGHLVRRFRCCAMSDCEAPFGDGLVGISADSG